MYRCITEDHKNVDRQEREFTRQRRETIHASFGVAVFHFEMAPLDVAEVAHPQQKLAAQVDCYRVRGPRRIEIAEPHDFRLLRARCEWPRGRAAEQRDELAPPHGTSPPAETPGELRLSHSEPTGRTRARIILPRLGVPPAPRQLRGRATPCSP